MAIAFATLELDAEVDERHCLACSRPVDDGVGSLRCLDCREDNIALDPRLVAQWQATGAHF
jgi:hypothetical protein